ncbi:3'(2'),5'-bisphosphate nucleotidase CysQ [Microbacter sp. GSS18]|nr:3'(2'),5'-bisphosphate nucleotidase CysQ [Microbacter sp. GSS18]
MAVSVAGSAAAVLLGIRAEHGLEDARGLKSAGDAGAQAHIASRLAAERPDDAVLSEEAKDSPARLSASRVWIVDPLDGTREFSEGRDDWAVHVALWESGDLTVGAVALGGPDVVLDSASVSPPPARGDGPLRIAVSRSRPPAIVAHVAEQLGAELVPMGSAGVKICAVVTGEVDAYVHGGGQFEWDSAAPVAVARAAGLHTSRLDGSDLVYNRADPYLPDLVVCRPELAGDVMGAIDRARVAVPDGEGVL